MGGGLINFYGIHLIALAQALLFTGVEYSILRCGARLWQCQLVNGKKTIIISINIDSSIDSFELWASNSRILAHETPFSATKRSGLLDNFDIRSSELAKVFPPSSSSFSLLTDYVFNESVLHLWSKIIDHTVHEH